MIASFIFLGFANLVLCSNENEGKLHNPSDSDAYNIFNNYPNLNYGNLQVNLLHSDGSSLFGSRLNSSNQLTDLDSFPFYDQDAKLNQSIGYFDDMIPDSTTFEKDQEPQVQVPISNFYSTFSNQQSSMNQITSRPFILSQNPLNSDQNAIISSNLQPFPISSGQIQEFQNKLIGLGDNKVNNGKLKQAPRRKFLFKPWKAREHNNLLKGINKYGTQWKKIFSLYDFEEGRTKAHLRHKFRDLKRGNKIVQTQEGKWKFINQGELTDLVRGERENEQIQGKKEDHQGDAELVSNESKNDLGDSDQNKGRCWSLWKSYEFVNLVDGVNIHGKNWKKISESFEFEQGRTPNNLASQFYISIRRGRVRLDEDSNWKFVNERYSIYSDESEPSKAAGNQIRGKEKKKIQKQKRHKLPWKKHELDSLLKGVNKHGRSWKIISGSYEFKGRSSGQLASRFVAMKDKGQIIYEAGLGWKYTDLYGEKICNKVIFERDLMKGPFNNEKTRRVNWNL